MQHFILERKGDAFGMYHAMSLENIAIIFALNDSMAQPNNHNNFIAVTNYTCIYLIIFDISGALDFLSVLQYCSSVIQFSKKIVFSKISVVSLDIVCFGDLFV